MSSKFGLRSASWFALIPLPCCCTRLPPPRFPSYIPKTPGTPALMAPCWPILTLISVLATLSLKSKFLSFYTLDSFEPAR